MLDQLALVAAIPSPASDGLHVGPLEVRAYGLMIGLGVVVAVWIAQRRWAARGGDPDDITALAVWAVPAGVVGARDVVAPALPVAQAIGRLGNGFNQELYGRPTELPWAMREASSRRARPGRVSGRGSAPHESR